MRSTASLIILSATMTITAFSCTSETTQSGQNNNLTAVQSTPKGQKLVADVEFKGTVNVGTTPTSFTARLKYGENIGNGSDWILTVDLPGVPSSTTPQVGEKTINLYAVYHEKLVTLSSSNKVINDKDAEWRLVVKRAESVSILKAFHLGKPVTLQ